MADLIDRISGEDDSRPKINLHRFMAAERLYVLGEFTRVQLDAEFDFQGAEQTQATQLADAIDGQSNITNKIVYIMRVESVCMCVEDGDDRLYHSQDGTVNKTKVYEDILIAGS